MQSLPQQSQRIHLTPLPCSYNSSFSIASAFAQQRQSIHSNGFAWSISQPALPWDPVNPRCEEFTPTDNPISRAGAVFLCQTRCNDKDGEDADPEVTSMKHETKKNVHLYVHLWRDLNDLSMWIFNVWTLPKNSHHENQGFGARFFYRTLGQLGIPRNTHHYLIKSNLRLST